MKLPKESRPILVAAAWLATAAATYSIGRITAPSVTVSKGPSGPGISRSVTSPGTSAGAMAPPERLYEPRPAGSSSDSTPLTTEQVTQGMELGEWLKKALSDDDDIARTANFLRLLETLNTPEDLQAALDALGSRSNRRGYSGHRERSMLLQKWTQLDPQGAVTYAAGLEGKDDRIYATSSVLGHWTRSDPNQALAWAKANGQGENEKEGNFAVAAVVSQLARTDLDSAMQVAATEPYSGARGRMMDSLVSEFINQRGLETARDAIMNLPAGTFREGLTAKIAEQLARKDGAAATTWALNLPPGDGRIRALTTTVDRWSREDPVAAGTFLAGFPASPESDPLRERFAYNVSRDDPQTAIAWANTITADGNRNRAIENVVRNWIRKDAAAAQTWVAQSALPDQTKARLLPKQTQTFEISVGGPGQDPGRARPPKK